MMPTTKPIVAPIAFFDSGIGGLTVLQEALRQMPYEHYLYFADSDAAPYGTRSSLEIEALVTRAIEFLVARHTLKALVVACNTATSVAIDTLRATYSFPIIGMEPAVKPALAQAIGQSILVCATERTLQAPKLEQLIHQLNATRQVQRLSLQELVVFAEQGNWAHPAVEQYLQQQFLAVNWSTIGAVVLGCTHFPYFLPLLRRFIPVSIPILDGHAGTIRHLRERIIPTTHTVAPVPIYYRSYKEVDLTVFQPYLERAALVRGSIGGERPFLSA